ncbi:MAG: 1-phosphofructokinase [Alphaproteobacteria bacterium]|jgi:1-phosphofructokinase|nr:1-phosphofructokinase [Alphaproteobacteria bacterium]
MIYTLTLNPAVDYFLQVNDFNEGGLNIASSSNIISGGKGINVSLVLSNLQVQSTALGFLGGYTGNIVLKTLTEKNVITDFTEVDANTRINIKLYNQNTAKETEIAGISPKITENQIDNLINKITNILKERDVLVLAGSIPSSVVPNIYKIISQKVNLQVKIILDTRGNLLKENIHNNFLIKPNKVELEEMFQISFNNTEDIVKACDYFFQQNVSNIIVSMGAEGSLFINKNHVYQALPIKLDVKNSVGAGDSMVAGFIYGVAHNKSLEDCYRFAVASSLATISGEGLATMEKLNNFYSQIKIQQIK